MKRSAFNVQRPPRPAKQIGPEYTIRPRAAAVAVAGPARPTVAVPKDGMLQHLGYMAAVRKLPCAFCNKIGPNQFCHADILGAGGKGLGIKSDCRLGWPGCMTCHFFVGTSGTWPKRVRQAFELAAGRRTRATIRSLGQWPARLPSWPGDEVASWV